MQYKIKCSTILRNILQVQYLDLPTFFASTGLLRAGILVRPLWEVLMHCGLVQCRLELIFFLRISDLIGDVFSCASRLKRVLFACSEKGVCRQYRPSPLCTSCIYRLLASMAVLFQESSTLLCGLCCFLLVSKCVHLAMWLMICG